MEQKETQGQLTITKPTSFWQWLAHSIVLLVVVLFALISAILYIPAVQNFTADYVTKSFSDKINGEVKIGKIKLHLTKGLVVDDVLILDKENGDTIIAVESVNSSFRDNIISILNKKLSLKTVELSGLRGKDYKGSQTTMGKLSQLLSSKKEDDRSIVVDTISDHKDAGKKKIARKSFDIDIERLILNDVDYMFVDSVKGETLWCILDRADLGVRSIDLVEKNFVFDDLDLTKPIFSISYFEGSNFIPIEEPPTMEYDESKIYEAADTANFSILAVEIKDGVFKFDDSLRPVSVIAQSFDPGHFGFKAINTKLSNLQINSIAEISAKIKSGNLESKDEAFKVEGFVCENFALTNRRMTFDSIRIQTKGSDVKDKLVFKYRDIKDFQLFKDKVILETKLIGSRIGIQDLTYFAPLLKDNAYFSKNVKKHIKVSGLITGRINSLNATDMVLRLADQIVVKGRMNSRNLSDVNNSLLNLDLSEFTVSVSTLNALIPGFNPPENFYKLGKIRFNGRFDGYFQDFVAYGDLISDLGTVELDMRLDLKEGAELAQYSGTAALRRFDLARWSGNSAFGIIEMDAQVKDGKGLRLESVSASVVANVNVLEFKDYTYKDFQMNGTFEQSLFDGTFVISDPNIDLNFNGTIDFNDSIPSYDFVADVNSLKLSELNILEENFGIQGNLVINARGTDINNAEGLASGSSFILFRNDNEFKLDSFNLKATGAYPTRRTFLLNSSLIDVELNGFFKLEELPDAFIASLKTNYPAYTKMLNPIKYPNPSPGYDFNINASIKESEDIFEVLFNQSIFISNATLLGRISDTDNRSALDIDFPFLEVNGNILEGIKGDLFAREDEGELNLSMDGGTISNFDFYPVEIYATAERENISFKIKTDKLLDSFTNIVLEGNLAARNKNFKINIRDSGFDAFGSNWRFNNKNNVLLGNLNIAIDDLNLSDGEKTLKFDDINGKGVGVKIEELNTSFFNRLISSDRVSMRGVINGYVDIENIFDFQGVDLDLEIPSFGFNDHEFGKVKIQANSQILSEPILYTLTTIDSSKSLSANGYFDYKAKTNSGELRISKYPFNLLEYIIADGISETAGEVSGTLSYRGLWDFPKVKGNVVIEKGATKIDYLGVKYKIGNKPINLREGYLDFSEGELIDSKGNIAIAQGGLKHESFRNFVADVRLRSPQFIGLNTTKFDNPSYYGYAQGQMDISFSGPLENIYINVNATTGKGSRLVIPVDYSTEEITSSFIEIINKNEVKDSIKFEPVILSGLRLDMDVGVTEDAEVLIIFDETANDLIESRGRGAIQLSIDADGNFDMRGNYQVVSGEYLFTIPSLLVNKSFKIVSGGTIEWTGDPLDANLNIIAEYSGLRASLSSFLEEYTLGSERLQNEAKTKTEVALGLNLGGTILSPILDFKISLPSLTGELKPLAEGKLRTLEASKDAYLEQVFGLILWRSFSPTNSLASNTLSNISSAGYNTISEFVSSQFSLFVSSLFEEALEGNSYLSGIDFNFGASKYNNLIGANSSFLPDEYDVNLTSSFNENKWNVQIGGQYVIVDEFQTEGSPFFIPNLVIEYYITDDRRLKLNFYGKFDRQDVTQSRRLKSGVGLSYRKEFDSLLNFAKEVNKEAKQKTTPNRL